MSYCVNCGVELEKSIRKCPLCNTPVINPNDLAKLKEINLSNFNTEKVNNMKNRKHKKIFYKTYYNIIFLKNYYERDNRIANNCKINEILLTLNISPPKLTIKICNTHSKQKTNKN